MAEPTSSAAAAGGVALWKLGAGLLAMGFVANALGFLILRPRTIREAASRLIATMASSAIFGPALALWAYSQWPAMFEAGGRLAVQVGQPQWHGLAAVAVPWVCMAGLPAWWILGAAMLWLDRRKGKDLGELARDARADIAEVVKP